jgi:hypothetical protein
MTISGTIMVSFKMRAFKKPLPQHDNFTKHLKFGEPITFNLSWDSRQEYSEVDFGYFSAMSVPTLSFRKSELAPNFKSKHDPFFI